MSMMRCDRCERLVDTDFEDVTENDAGVECVRCLDQRTAEAFEDYKLTKMRGDLPQQIKQAAQDIIDAGRNPTLAEPFRSFLNAISGRK